MPAALGLGLALGWGITGLWWGLLIGLSAVALALFARFRLVSSREIVPIHGRPGPLAAGEHAP
jgi:MATE family multidrug resistance protein